VSVSSRSLLETEFGTSSTLPPTVDRQEILVLEHGGSVLSHLAPFRREMVTRDQRPQNAAGWGLIETDCIGCGSAAVTERPDLTAQGYRRFRCRDRGQQFNVRSDGVLNRASLPSDIIAFVVFCRLRYRLTLRDLSEIMLLRGFTVSYERVRQWEAKLLSVMGDALRKRRHGIGRSAGQSWYVDETYLKVRGRWCYLYRAIDRDGNLIDTMLSQTRGMSAARGFFRSARSVVGFVPDRVTTDGHNSYPCAIRSTLGRNVRHRTSVYLNNRVEQHHRGIKGRIRCMRGFKEPDAAGRFCREHDELRNFLRSRSRHNPCVSATRRRCGFFRHARIALGIMEIA
jgi:putative transposase